MKTTLTALIVLLAAGSVFSAVTLDVPDSLYGLLYDTVDVPVLVAN